jgi:hypothetical protein
LPPTYIRIIYTPNKLDCKDQSAVISVTGYIIYGTNVENSEIRLETHTYILRFRTLILVLRLYNVQKWIHTDSCICDIKVRLQIAHITSFLHVFYLHAFFLRPCLKEKFGLLLFSIFPDDVRFARFTVLIEIFSDKVGKNCSVLNSFARIQSISVWYMPLRCFPDFLDSKNATIDVTDDVIRLRI